MTTFDLNTNSDLIIQIFHDNKSNKLATLRCKTDCSIYIEIIDLTNFNLELITLNNNFYDDSEVSEKSESLFKPEYVNYFYLNDDIVRNFIVHKYFYSFEIDFNHKSILLYSLNNTYTIKNSEPRYEYITNIYTRVFDFNGEVKKSLKSNDFLPDGTSFHFIQSQILSLELEYTPYLKLWSLNTDTYFEIDLFDDTKIEELIDEFDFEYIQHYSINKEKNILGYIGENPTYGAAGVRVFDISDIYNMKLIYKKDFLSSIEPHYIAINPAGDKYITLNLIYEKSHHNVEILTCNLTNNNEPISYKSNHKIELGTPVFMTFYKDSIICMVTFDKILLSDLIQKKDIILDRDLNSAYFVTLNYIFYVSDNKIIIYQE